MQRTQIYLDDEQHRALTALAKRRGQTASAVIREAIDGYLADQLSPRDRLDRLRSLGARLMKSDHEPAGDSAEDVETLRAADAARLDFRP